MRAHFTHNESVIFHLEGKAVGASDTTFPIISWIIHFFDIQRRSWDQHKQLKMFVHGILYVFGQLAMSADKSLVKRFSYFAVFKALDLFWYCQKGQAHPLWYVFVCFGSSCCHSFAIKYSWSGCTTLPAFKTISLCCFTISSRSPTPIPTFCTCCWVWLPGKCLLLLPGTFFLSCLV